MANVPHALDNILNVLTLSGLCLRGKMLCLHLRVGMCSVTFMLKCVSSEYKHGELAKKPGGKTVLPSLHCERESTFYSPCAIYDLTTFLIHHITGRYTTKEGNSALVRIPALWFFFSPTPKHLSVHVVSAFLCKVDLEACRAVISGVGNQASVNPSGTSALQRRAT